MVLLINKLAMLSNHVLNANDEVDQQRQQPEQRIPKKPIKPKLEALPPLDEETRGIIHSLCASLGHFESTSSIKMSCTAERKYYLGLNYQDGLEDLGGLIVADEDGQVISELLQMDFVSIHLLPSLGALTDIALQGRLFTRPLNGSSLSSFIEQVSLILDQILLFSSPSTPVHPSLISNLLSHRRRIKYAFHSPGIWITLQTLLISLTQAHSENATILKGSGGPTLVSKIIRLVAQVITIPDSESPTTLMGQTSKIIHQIYHTKHPLHKTSFFDILLLASSSLEDGGEAVSFFFSSAESISIMVSIFSSILEPCDPDTIAKMSFPMAAQDDRSAMRSLQDEQRNLDCIVKKRPVRHSRFSGSLVVKLSTGKDMILRNSSSSATDQSNYLDLTKRHQYRKKKAVVNFRGDRNQFLSSSTSSFAAASDSQTEGTIAALLEELTSGPLQILLSKWREMILDSFGSFSASNSSGGGGAFKTAPTTASATLTANITGLDLISWITRWCRKCAALLTLSTGSNRRKEVVLQRLKEIIGDHQLPIRMSIEIMPFLAAKEYQKVCSIVIFEKEYLRALEAIEVVDCETTTKIQLDLFYRLGYIQSFRKALQKSSSCFPFRLVAHVLEGNYCLLKQLKTFSTQHQHLFVASADDVPVDDEAATKEIEFSLSNLLVEYSNEAVVDSLLSLIPHLPQMADPAAAVSRYIAYMASLLLAEGGKHLFYRAKALSIINSFLQHRGCDGRWRADNKDLLKICRWIASAFVDDLSKDATLIISTFFPSFVVSGGSLGCRSGRSGGGITSNNKNNNNNNSIKAKEIPSTLKNDRDRMEWVVRSLVHRELGHTVRWMLGELFCSASLRDPSVEKNHPYPLHPTGRVRKDLIGDEYCVALMALLFSTDNGGKDWYVCGQLKTESLFSKASMLEDSFKKVIEEEDEFDGSGAVARVDNGSSDVRMAVSDVSDGFSDGFNDDGDSDKSDNNNDNNDKVNDTLTTTKTITTESTTKRKRMMIIDDDDDDE